VELDEMDDGTLSEWLAGPDGVKLIAAGEQFAASGMSPANAQARIVELVAAGFGKREAAWIGHAAWGMAAGRAKAIAKIGEVGEIIVFDTDGLQMASSAATAAYHARLLMNHGVDTVVDMTAGIGIDAIFFARRGIRVIAYETDPVRQAYLAANCAAADVLNRVDIRREDSLAASLPSDSFVYLDPPRRTETSRWGNRDCAESMIDSAIAARPIGLLCKLAPSAEHALAERFGCALEYVSAGRECREALLRGGALAEGCSSPSAVVLPSDERLFGSSARAPIAEPVGFAYLYEPDPAVIRAGLIDLLATKCAMARIDRDIAYLLSNEPIETPFATGYRILAAMPYHRKAVQAWIDDREIGSLIVKKRGVPDNPEQVRALFKLRGDSEAVLALTRQGKRVWALMLAPAASPACDTFLGKTRNG
jgi:hypothetical protein